MKKNALFILLMILSYNLPAQQKEETKGSFSGLAFLDYLNVFYHHDPVVEGQHGFYFRRLYLTYNYKFDNAFSSRLRFEMNNEGNYINDNAMVPFVKDAWIKYTFSRHQFILGISPTPTFAVIEKVWGYRSVEKTPLDLQRMASSRDFGLAANGKLGNDMLKYHVMFSNGSSNKQEIDKGKSFLGSLGLYPTKELIFEAYGEFSDYEGPYNGYTYQGFAAYTADLFRVGFQYSDQTIQTDSTDIKRRVFSGFAVVRAVTNVSVFARVDRMIDANPAGNKVAYTPFDTTIPFWFFIFGVDVKIIKNLSLIPNIEYTMYDKKNGGETSKNDFYGKLTFYWQFK